MHELKSLGVLERLEVLVMGSCCTTSSTTGSALFHLQSLEEIHRLIEVEVVATTSLVRLLLPSMISRRREEIGGGRIRFRRGSRILFLTTSSAGPHPLMAVSSAASSFLTSYTSSLRRELINEGVLVTTATIAGPRHYSREEDRRQRSKAMTAEIYSCIKSGREKVFPEKLHFLCTTLLRWLPSPLVGSINRGVLLQQQYSPLHWWKHYRQHIMFELRQRRPLQLHHSMWQRCVWLWDTPVIHWFNHSNNNNSNNNNSNNNSNNSEDNDDLHDNNNNNTTTNNNNSSNNNCNNSNNNNR